MPHDPALAAERSLLAWRRTVLALAGLSVVVLRLLSLRLGPGALVPAVAVAVAGLGVMVITVRRPTEPGGADGRRPALAAAGLVLLALTVLGGVLAG